MDLLGIRLGKRDFRINEGMEWPINLVSNKISCVALLVGSHCYIICRALVMTWVLSSTDLRWATVISL